jgi:uncharacterized protein (DUF433 family)
VDVVTVLNQLAAGDSIDEMARGYRITTEDVQAAVAFAARVVAKSSKTIKETFE